MSVSRRPGPTPVGRGVGDRAAGARERARRSPGRGPCSSSTSPCVPGAVREPILASWTRSRLCARPSGPPGPAVRAGSGRRHDPDPGGRARAAGDRRPVRHRAGERDPLRRRRRRAQPAHRRLGARAAPQPRLAGPRVQLRRAVRRHERHRHGAGGARPGPGVRPRALRGAAGGTGLRGRADPAPGDRQGPRRHRPDVLAARRRAAAGRHRRHAHPPHRADAAGAVGGARARRPERLPGGLPAQPRPGARPRRRPADDERPGTRAARPRRPGAAAGRGERGPGRGTPAPAARRPAERPDGAGAHPADGERERDRRRRPRRPADQLGARPGGPVVRRAAHAAVDRGGLRRAPGPSAAGRWTGTCWRGSGSCSRASRGRAGRRWPAPPTSSGRPPRGCACSPPRTPGRTGRRRWPRSSRPAAARWCSPTSTGCRPRSWPRWPSCWSPTASRPTPTGPGSSPRCGRRRASPRRSWPTCCPASRARSSSPRCATTSRTSPSWSRTCSPASATAPP